MSFLEPSKLGQSSNRYRLDPKPKGMGNQLMARSQQTGPRSTSAASPTLAASPTSAPTASPNRQPAWLSPKPMASDWLNNNSLDPQAEWQRQMDLAEEQRLFEELAEQERARDRDVQSYINTRNQEQLHNWAEPARMEQEAKEQARSRDILNYNTAKTRQHLDTEKERMRLEESQRLEALRRQTGIDPAFGIFSQEELRNRQKQDRHDFTNTLWRQHEMLRNGQNPFPNSINGKGMAGAGRHGKGS